MYEKILLAVDGSEHAKLATKHAISLAEQFQATLDVIYVEDKEKSKDSIHYGSNKVELEKKRREKLKPIEDLLKSTAKEFTTHLLYGDPATEIIHFAKQQNIDCIVIGSRGLNPLQKLLLGSVSSKVTEQASCPVFVIK